jgi:hypothetical protein
MMIILLDRAWDILVKNRYPYFALNMLYYGLIILLMTYAAFDAPFQKQITETSGSTYMTGAIKMYNKTSVDGEVIKGMGITFVANVLGSSYAAITLPSFVIPFIGIFVGLYRAIMVGIVFSPFNADIRQIIIPHIPTLFIEGQACILAMLGTYIQGRAMFWPKSMGQTSRWKSYVEGVRQTGTLYMLIMAILLISAIYGVIEVAWLIG